MARKLLYLNGLGVVAVILFHAAGMGFVAMFAWLDRYAPGLTASDQIGSAEYWALRVVEQVIIYAIPVFLFVSGYSMALVTGKEQTTVGWRVIAARLGTLMPPYILWSTVALVLRYLEGRRYSPPGLARAYLTGSTNEVFYFIPLLAQFYLLSPLLIPLARKHWKLLLLIAGGVQVALHLCQYPQYLGWNLPFAEQILRLSPKWLFYSRMLWFPLGLVVAFHLADFKQRLAWVGRWALPAALVLLVAGVAEWEIFFSLSGLEWLPTRETILDSLYALVVIFGALLAELAALPWLSRLTSLGTRSYGVYLIHSMVMEYAARAVYRFAPALLGYQLFLQPFLIVLGLGIPLLLMVITDRSPLRRYYKLLYG